LRAFVAIAGTFVQIVTAVLALALPAYAFKVLFGNWIAGFVVGSILLAFFESVKHLTVNKVAVKFWGKGRIDMPLTAFVLLILCASVSSSYFGTPILVREFSPKPVKPIESDIVKAFDSSKVTLTAYYTGQKADFEQKAAAIFSANSWKGTLTREARPAQLEMQKGAKAAADSLTAGLARIEAQKEAAIASAMSDYNKAVQRSASETENVGFWLGIVTLILEFSFIGCFFWLQYYDFRAAIDLGIIKSHKEAKQTVITKPAPTVTEMQDAQPRPSSNTNIGFHNEGKIVLKDGEPAIYCQTEEGLKPFSKSVLAVYISRDKKRGNFKRAEYWQAMKSKLSSK
jgi:hypothetical protein